MSWRGTAVSRIEVAERNAGAVVVSRRWFIRALSVAGGLGVALAVSTGARTVALSLIVGWSAFAAPGDALYIQKDRVNVRAGPSTDAAVLMQLNLGHKLIEFARQGEWVNVGIERTGGKDGWIHDSLIGKNAPSGKTVAQPDRRFDQFKQAVSQLNARVRQIAGVEFFTHVENLGDGIVQLTATGAWLAAPYGDRESNLNTLYNLWDAADGSGLPIMVHIVDPGGSLVMKKEQR